MADTTKHGKAGTEQRREQQPRAGTQQATRERTEAHRGAAEDLSSTLTEKASEAWETTKEGVQSAASSFASTAENTWDELSTFVRRYPWASLAFGCGVGYLVIRAVGSEDRIARGMSQAARRYQGYRASPPWRGEEYGQPQASQGSTSTMTERVGQAWERAKQGAQDMASAVGSRTSEALDAIGDWSREYPRATPATGLLIGACGGFLAGWTLGCKTSKSR